MISLWVKRVCFALPVVLLIFAQVVQAAKPIYSGGRDRAAIRGYDPVAYFTENQPVKGDPDISLEHKGATWFFTSRENRELFTSNPEKYEPQYGGYCAYAVARDTTASSKPEYFTIHDGKLYLNYSKSVYKRWIKEMDSYITQADGNWPGLVEE